MKIIPAIDIIGGKCVRLTQGDYTRKTVYNESPLEVAKQFEAIGIERLHLVDLDGAKTGKVINLRVLETIARHTKLIIDFGGGIKQDADIENVFNTGAAIATIGSIAVKKPEIFYTWVKKYGTEKILLGADVKNEKIAISGWLEETQISIFDFIALNSAAGIKNVFCTDISKDGLLHGPALDLYKNIIAKNPGISLIASGGISNIKDVFDLQEAGCTGAIIGKAIYENKITMKELQEYVLR